MTLTLHIGVVDLPYAEKGGITTGDVAQILEDKYHVMGVFASMQEDAIAVEMTEGLKGQLENLMMGAPPSQDPFADGCAQIEKMFKTFLEEDEISFLGIPGTPTEAAKKGVSHRFKGKKSGAPRPSFIDTGLYESSAKVWVD